MRDFKNLICWQKAHELTLKVYEITILFPNHEFYILVPQMRRSASSIPTNIAEGCGRSSKPDVARFFDIAIASANELEYQFLLSKDLNYISLEQFTQLSEKVIEVRKLTNGYKKTLQ